MNNKFKLQNFRVFDNKGTEFEIAPITVLTGCNSSGKSSVLKALMLFGDMFQNVFNDYINGNPVFLNQYEIKFNSGMHNLGTYPNAVSKYSNQKDISIGYSKYSNYLMGAVHVEIVMSINEKDFLKGVIKNIKISSNESEIAYFEVVDNNLNYRINALEIKKHFFEFYTCYKEYHELGVMLNRDKSIDDMISFPDYESYSNEPSINQSKIDVIINSYKQAISRDNVGKLSGFLSQIDSRFQSLFFLPILDWFGEAKKENIENRVYEKIKELNDVNDEFKLIEKTLLQMIEDFKTSDCVTVKEYFLSVENKYLSDFSETLHLARQLGREESSSTQDIHMMMGDVTSFIGLIHSLFVIDEPPYASVDIDSIISMDLDEVAKYRGYRPTLEKNFYTLVKFSSFDPNFDRIEEHIPDGIVDFNYQQYHVPRELNAANLFFSSLLQECLISAPSFLTKIGFIDAVKANIQRMYTFENQGTPFNKLIQYYLESLTKQKSTKGKSKGYQIGDFIKKWIKLFELGEDILFELRADGLGVQIYLIRGEEKILLADEGSGITQILAILLQIELNIPINEYNYTHPFIKGDEKRYKESTIAVEEPEINLHPKFQSLLADMFMDAYKSYNIRFIIETHSEYLIRKLQTLVAKKELTPDNVALHYIYNHDKSKRPAGKPQVLNIKIKEDGRLSEPFGAGFFDEADNLAMDLLTIKSLN